MDEQLTWPTGPAGTMTCRTSRTRRRRRWTGPGPRSHRHGDRLDFYTDLADEFSTSYTIDGNHLLNEDRPA